MEPTTIILIVLFVICGLVLLWAIKNGNNIKFAKKEKKNKSKDSKKDNFKEIIPKEKKEKNEKKKETIRDSVKEEKAGKIEPPTNKVMKVTEEDFKSNNITIPKTLGDENKTQGIKKDALGKPGPIFQDKNKGFDFDDKFLKEEFAGLGINDDFLKPMMDNDPLLDNSLLPMSENDPFMNGKDVGFGFGDDLLMDFNNFPPPAPLGMPVQPRGKGEIKPESIEARLEKVFGNSMDAIGSGVKEVMVGEILSGNRSKVNRELREKRKKWMK